MQMPDERIQELEEELVVCAWAYVFDAVMALEGEYIGFSREGWEANILRGHDLWRRILHWDETKIATERASILADLDMDEYDWSEYDAD